MREGPWIITGGSESCYFLFPVIFVRKNMGKYMKPTLLDFFKAIINVCISFERRISTEFGMKFDVSLKCIEKDFL